MAKSQAGRTLTLVVKIVDEYPSWITDAHIKGPQHGVRVIAIAEGDIVKKNTTLERELARHNLDDDIIISEHDRW